jgi:hypothetical protein
MMKLPVSQVHLLSALVEIDFKKEQILPKNLLKLVSSILTNDEK